MLSINPFWAHLIHYCEENGSLVEKFGEHLDRIVENQQENDQIAMDVEEDALT